MKKKSMANKGLMQHVIAFGLAFLFLVNPVCFAANSSRNSAFEPPQNNRPNYNYTQNTSSSTLKGCVTQVGKGKVLNAFVQSSVSTIDSANGDPIVAVLAENWVENGKIIAEAGSVINGTITSVDSAGRWSKDGSLQINFTTMETPAGEIYSINAEKIDIQVEQEQKRWVKTAMTIGGAALAAAAIGCLFGLGGSSESMGKNVLRGAAIGGGIGAVGGIVAAGTKTGEEISIPANTNFEIKLLDDIKAVSY